MAASSRKRNRPLPATTKRRSRTDAGRGAGGFQLSSSRPRTSPSPDAGPTGAARLDALGPAFAGKKVAVFGLGDSVGFADTFCVAAETLAAAARDAGATLVGDVLKLDESNEPNKTDGRIAEWVAKVKAEAGIQ